MKAKKSNGNPDYNMERAMELRAVGIPGFSEKDVEAAGDIPFSRSNHRHVLKSAKHPSVILELLHGYLGEDVHA